MSTTIVETPEGDSGAVEEAELTAVVAASSAAGVSAANADSAAQSAEEASIVAEGTAIAATIAVEAAEESKAAAVRATEAEYATHEQMAAVEGTLSEIRDLLIAKAQEPAPEPTKEKTVKRERPPAKPQHFLQRRIGGKK